MSRDNEHIRPQRVAGTDHGAQIPFVGGTVKQHDEGILCKLHPVQPILPHLDHRHQLRSVLLAAQLSHELFSQTIVHLGFHCPDHLRSPSR